MDTNLKQRRKLWNTINDSRLKTDPELRNKVLTEATTYFAFRVYHIKFAATAEDFDLLAFASEVFCPWLVDIILCAVDELIDIVDSDGSFDNADGFYYRAEGAIKKYAGEDRKARYLAIGEKLETMGRRFHKHPSIH